MAKAHYAAVGILTLLVAAGAGSYYLNTDGAPTGNLAKQVYSLSTGQDLEVMKVEDRGSLDRVVLKPADGNQVTETYVTDDGQYVVQNPVSIENFTARMEARNEFVSCLSDNNAQFYSIITQNRTFARHARMAQLQIQVLGGTTGLQDVFGGPGTRETVQVNGQRIPIRNLVLNYQATQGIVWTFEDSDPRGGIMTVPQLENVTGCTYSGPSLTGGGSLN